MGSARQSIRRRLLGSLVTVLLLLVLTAAMFAYRGAVSAANDAYDRALLEPAVLLDQNVRVEGAVARLDMPAKALQAVLFDQHDDVLFQVRAPDDTVIAGDADFAVVGALPRGGHAFRDAVFRGTPMRVAALRGENGVLVQIAETLHKRERLVREVMVAEVVPTLLIAAASIGLAWLGVVNGLAPLARIRAELLSRSAHDLHPLGELGAPEEIAPVVQAFNRLLLQVAEASALQKRFLANAAHQLRTPLAALQLHLELLLRRSHSAEAKVELERLREAVQRAGHLTHQLLALAKAETASDGPLPLQAVDLHRLGETAARQWVPQALAREIDLGFELDHVHVKGDAFLLSELLDNLVDNALRYTPRQGSITVRCGEHDNRPYLSVEDTGPGIPADERQNVLERFYRVPGTPGDGSGLGLAIVKEVADAHDAELLIDSGGPAGGTRVTVRFARAARAGADPAEALSSLMS